MQMISYWRVRKRTGGMKIVGISRNETAQSLHKAKMDVLVSSRETTNQNQGDGQPRRKPRSSHRIKVPLKCYTTGHRLCKGCQAWQQWNELSGVMCDRKLPHRLNMKIYSIVIQPVFMYGAETWAMKRKELLLTRTEIRTLRWAMNYLVKY